MTDKPVYEEIASSRDGEDAAGGLVDALRQPRDEILRTRGQGDLEIYEQVKRDDQVHSALQQRFEATIARDWIVEPGGSRQRDRRAADFLRAQLQGLRFDDITRKMLNGIFYGYAVAECLWVPDGGQVVLDDIRVRRQRRFAFDMDGGLRLLRRGVPKGEPMPGRKFWTFSAGGDDDDDVYGRGLAYWCYWPVWLKRNGLRFWSIWMEKFAAPTAMGKLPQEASDEERKKLMHALRSITLDSAVIMNQTQEAHLMQALNSAGGDYQLFYKQMDAAVSKVVLSQTMTTDDGSSRAQAEVHEDVKDDVVDSDADLVCESFADQVGRWLTDWNFPGAQPPRVSRPADEGEDLKARAERDLTITKMGYAPTQDYIDETYGEGFEPRQASAPAGDRASSFAEESGGAAAEAEDQRDDLADQLEEVTRAHTDAWLDEIRRILDTSSDFGEAMRRLETLHPELDVSELAKTIGDGLAVANLAGRGDTADAQ